MTYSNNTIVIYEWEIKRLCENELQAYNEPSFQWSKDVLKEAFLARISV